MEEIAKNEEIIEQLKVDNQIEWIQKINNIQNQANKIMYTEFIYE